MHFLLMFFVMILQSFSLGLVVDIQYSILGGPCHLNQSLVDYLLDFQFAYQLFTIIHFFPFFVKLIFRFIDAGTVGRCAHCLF